MFFRPFSPDNTTASATSFRNPTNDVLRGSHTGLARGDRAEPERAQGGHRGGPSAPALPRRARGPSRAPQRSRCRTGAVPSPPVRPAGPLRLTRSARPRSLCSHGPGRRRRRLRTPLRTFDTPPPAHRGLPTHYGGGLFGCPPPHRGPRAVLAPSGTAAIPGAVANLRDAVRAPRERRPRPPLPARRRCLAGLAVSSGFPRRPRPAMPSIVLVPFPCAGQPGDGAPSGGCRWRICGAEWARRGACGRLVPAAL